MIITIVNKLSLHHFSHMIFKMTVFTVVFGFLKMSGDIVNFSKNQNCKMILQASNNYLNICTY